MLLSRLNGIEIFLSSYLCETPKFLRWKRTNRNNRIAKKWRKKYGAVLQYCRGVMVETPGRFTVCPCADMMLRKEFAKAAGPSIH